MTQEQPESTSDRLVRLTDLATELLREAQELANGSGEQLATLTRRSRTNRRLILAVIAGFTLDVVLTVAMAFGLLTVMNNAENIDSLTRRLDVAQTETRQRALCPLYQVFLDSKSPQGRARAEDPEKYDHAFEVIEDGYKALDCADFNENSDPWPSVSPKG